MNSVQNIKYSSPAIKPFILEFKEERPYKAERSIKEKIEFNNEIKFSKINFIFPKTNKPIFNNLSFEIKGSFVGLLGPAVLEKQHYLIY